MAKRGRIVLFLSLTVLLFASLSVLSVSAQTCTDSDSGKNYYVQGIVNVADLWLGHVDGSISSCDSLGRCTNHGVKVGRIYTITMAVFDGKLWLGLGDGSISSCDSSGRCTNHGDKGDPINAMAVFNSKLWLGLGDGSISSCDSSGRCTNYGDKGYYLESMAVFNSKLWLGHVDGSISSCDSSGRCTNYGDKGYYLKSMAVFDSKLWLGHVDGSISSCDSSGRCTNHGDKGEWIKSMAVFNGKLWLGLGDGSISSCDSSGRCTNHGDKGDTINSMAVFNSRLWLGHFDGSISSCDSSGSCTNRGVKGERIYGIAVLGKEYIDFCYNYNLERPCEGDEEGCVLIEYYCDEDGKLVKEKYDCPFGCKHGACISIPNPLDVAPETPDGCIDTKDLAFVAKCYGFYEKEECKKADVHGDKKIDANDYNLVYANYEAGLNRRKEPGDVCEGWRCYPREMGCNAIDDDCNGLVDEGLTRNCYTGPRRTENVGECKAGQQMCEMGKWGNYKKRVYRKEVEEPMKKDSWGVLLFFVENLCIGQTLPQNENCDSKDNDCDGKIDEGLTRSCYTGPRGTGNIGECKAGQQMCEMGKWGNYRKLEFVENLCPGQTFPTAEVCDGLDNNCDGGIDAIHGKPLHYVVKKKEIIERIVEAVKDFFRELFYGLTGIKPRIPPNKTYKICIKGEWFERQCAIDENCSNKVDNDCDYSLPERDWDCVRRGVFSKPGYSWRWWWERELYIYYTCGADAWTIPDYEFNPAKHSQLGMNPNDWRCVMDKIFYGDAVSNLKGLGLSIEKIGDFWLLDHVTGLAAFIRLFISSRVGRYIPRAEPSAWTYVIKKYCVDWDTAYSFFRTWVCFHKTFETEKIFDWHDKDGVNWMTPVQAQSVDHKGDYHPCGSCWAFSAVGAIEAQHNIENSNPNLDINLAEQELVSCEGGGGTCGGGINSWALAYVANKGILIEDCFEYLGCKLWSYPEGKYHCDEEYPCEPTCSYPKHSITSYDAIDTDASPEDIREAIKLRLRTKGPMSVCLDWDGAMYWDGDIVRCDYSQPFDQGHCVVLVGYNDFSSYWIFKNSHGTGFGENGYGKLGYGECRMETSRGSLFGVR